MTMLTKYTLTGGSVKVEYTVDGTVGGPLIFRDATYSDSFESKDIKTETTNLGQMISVTLEMTTDAGGERFGFLLPRPGEELMNTFQSSGIYYTFRGPNAGRNRWRCIDLEATASTIDYLPK